jgi:hypothetical protein
MLEQMELDSDIDLWELEHSLHDSSLARATLPVQYLTTRQLAPSASSSRNSRSRQPQAHEDVVSWIWHPGRLACRCVRSILEAMS